VEPHEGRDVPVGYDGIGERYTATRDPHEGLTFVRRLVEPLPREAGMPDLGCGAGAPVARWLLITVTP
jgi:hypothetical protein